MPAPFPISNQGEKYGKDTHKNKKKAGIKHTLKALPAFSSRNKKEQAKDLCYRRNCKQMGSRTQTRPRAILSKASQKQQKIQGSDKKWAE